MKLRTPVLLLSAILSIELFLSHSFAKTSTPAENAASSPQTPHKRKPKPKPSQPAPVPQPAPAPQPNPPAPNPAPAPHPAPKPEPGNGSGQTPTSGIFATCFSPGNCDQKLITFIDSANSTLDIAIYSITHTGISDAIKSAAARGVQVRMVVDRSQSKGINSQVNNLVTDGINLKIGNVEGIMHDKFTIVDGLKMETGSFNYTENATGKNAENQIYILDATVIRNYQDSFDALFANGLPN